MNSSVLNINAAQVAEVIDNNLSEFVEVTRETFVVYSSGATQQPLRSWVKTSDRSGLICMPGYVQSSGALAVKLLSYAHNNSAGVVALFDAPTGALSAMVDSHSITEYRTTAMSVSATQKLANPQSRTLAVYGTGIQARRHILMLKEYFPIDEIRVWNYREESGLKLVDELKNNLGLNATYESDPSRAALGADIIVVATNSRTPVLQREWLKDGVHVNALGAAQKDQRELDPKIMNEAVVYVDSKESALNESGDVMLSGAKIHAEIGEILTSPENIHCPGKITVFKSLGIAVQDAAAAKFVYDKLRKMNDN